MSPAAPEVGRCVQRVDDGTRGGVVILDTRREITSSATAGTAMVRISGWKPIPGDALTREHRKVQAGYRTARKQAKAWRRWMRHVRANPNAVDVVALLDGTETQGSFAVIAEMVFVGAKGES